MVYELDLDDLPGSRAELRSACETMMARLGAVEWQKMWDRGSFRRRDMGSLEVRELGLWFGMLLGRFVESRAETP